MSAGYSKRPLYQKLGIKEGFKVRIINAPENYFELLGAFPSIDTAKGETTLVDFIHLFSRSIEQVENQIIRSKDEIKKEGMVWVFGIKKHQISQQI